MRNIAAVKKCLLGEKQAVAELKYWWFATLQIHRLKILSITVSQMHFLEVYVPVICYAVWSLHQMWSEHCLWWSEGPRRPLPLYETQNNECDPILHAAHAASKTQDTRRKTQIHKRENFQEKKNSNTRSRGLRFGVNRWFAAKMQMKNVIPKASKLCQCHQSSKFRLYTDIMYSKGWWFWCMLQKMPLNSA